MMQLTALLAELGLNIQEAHAFSTTDGFSLDVFVVDGWPYEVLFCFRLSSFAIATISLVYYIFLFFGFKIVYYICSIESEVCWHVHSY